MVFFFLGECDGPRIVTSFGVDPEYRCGYIGNRYDLPVPHSGARTCSDVNVVNQLQNLHVPVSCIVTRTSVGGYISAHRRCAHQLHLLPHTLSPVHWARDPVS